ncbi:reverse transcriptase domain-containing protein [Lysobacter sp. Root667]|uniref:reverse transcriptase domain-containing protein n=1 Tax=Lysobacter sp. Root667 TaxID=1736581 RepID=UPI0009E836C2|nr:reverse transcriptase domain-containing protein [Lysobacter sp. Root667]
MGPLSLSPEAIAFSGLKTRAELAGWLGLTDKKLCYLLYVLPATQKYITFQVAKRDGSSRTIDAPHPALKQIQRKLLSVFRELAPATGVAKGYVNGVGVIDHARLHRRQRHVVLVDLENFFPSITFPRVRGALLGKPFLFPPKVATCIAQLCCKDGVLPQGAPTSPVLSNLICRSLDHKLLALAKANRCRVSRYADDICFSTSLVEVPSIIATLYDGNYLVGPALIAAIHASGFTINQKKFKAKSQRTQQLVTGLVVNRGVSLPRRWRRQLRVLLHLADKKGAARATEIASAWTKPVAFRRGSGSIEQLVRGKTNYAQHVDLRCDKSFSESIYRNYGGVRKLMPRPLRGIAFRVMTEGKTDLLHLESALKWFQERAEFAEFKPRFLNFPGDIGDVELLKTLQRIAKSDVPELTVGVFDYDNIKDMNKIGLAPGAHLQLGSRVYAMCLGEPAGFTGTRFCIENLYQKNQLVAMTSEARRVFLPEDFDQDGISLDGLFKRAQPRATAAIVSDKVVRLSDGFSASLSKAEFAEMIFRSVHPFDQIDFSGFGPTFNALRRIVEEVSLAG